MAVKPILVTLRVKGVPFKAKAWMFLAVIANNAAEFCTQKASKALVDSIEIQPARVDENNG